MEDKIIITGPPSAAEIKSLRLMICIGVFSMVFFLYSLLQVSNISYYPLYVLLMITMVYYSFKYLHEWYHYFSITTTPKPIVTRTFTVDILTTYCAGEPFDMLEQTLVAMQQVRYPHTSWCCDEAADPLVKELCERLGVRHVTRVQKNDAKAGNINHALQLATGEICLVLDPDHIPVPGILDEIIPYFVDPSIGFVQIVQAYYNQTETMVAKGAAQQTYQFYGPVMMTMNNYGTVQAIGANCTFRRSALDSIGGHASGLAEDMHTAMQLHAKGWRSVYLPAILTRGLVPATMSSYYKQQLKWSRGVWELFVTAFPKLFSKFTWRQKIHYATLPFHYLSGVIFLINFLIPVISLFTGYVPLQMDVLSFLLAAIPLFCMGIFIRHYVQKWVAEETERGFHIVGGILQIGTWWIHSIGILYTLIRKKVPYLPTPKNDADSLPLRLSLPNILIAVISLVAIVYGFMFDYTPYTAFMAALAFMQIIFMVFIISISGYVRDNSKLNELATRIKKRNGFIIATHGFVRKYSVALSIAVTIFFVFGFLEKQRLPEYLPRPLPGVQVFYRGLTVAGNEKTTLPFTTSFTAAAGSNDIRLVAININSAGHETMPDTAMLRKLYAGHMLPVLQWAPWQTGEASHEPADSVVLQNIIAGNYDSSIAYFARQLATMDMPAFFIPARRLQGTGFLPLATNESGAGNFIGAWQHLHHIFEKQGAGKIIWIWHPPSVANAVDYFPGSNYADWMGVQLTAYDALRYHDQVFGFDSLYRPYHRLPLNQSAGLPVIITGLPDTISNKTGWWKAAWHTIDTGFTEIKALVLADYAPAGRSQPSATGANTRIDSVFAAAPASTTLFALKKNELPAPAVHATRYTLSGTVKSVVYNKGIYWFRNRHTLNIRTLEDDIKAMKETGINTIERRMPGFYDTKLQQVLLRNKMNMVPKFWLLATPQVIDDAARMKDEKEKILSVIKKNMNRPNIIAWNLGDDVLFVLSNQCFKPDYFYYEQQYLGWLNELCTEIRKIDSLRPIVMDLHWNATGATRFQTYKTRVPLINYFMLEADEKYPQGLQATLANGMVWGKVPVALWSMLPAVQQSATIPAWQDIENTNFISLNGLLDMDGRKKESYGTVMRTWASKNFPMSAIPETKILRPAAITRQHLKLVYQLIYRKNGSYWTPYDQYEKNIRFEWYLVRIDQYGNTMFIKKIGEGKPYVKLEIPGDPQFYQLYAEAILGNNVKMVHASLNTPLE